MKLILRQLRPGVATVVRVNDNDGQVFMFTGGRVEAKRYIKLLRLCVGWENVPAFCEKKTRGRRPPTYVEIP